MFSLLWRYKAHVALVLVIGYLLIARARADATAAAAMKAKEQALEGLAKELGLAKGQVESDRAAWASLTRENATLAARLKAAGARPVEHTQVTATVTAKDQGSVQKVDNVATEWHDQYGRFSLDLKSLVLTRRQRFGLSLTVLLGVDQATKFENVLFQELVPATGEPIPSEEVSLATDFKVVKEANVVGAFHPRIVAAIGTVGYGGGVEVANLKENFNLSVLSLYRNGTVAFGLQPGWRVQLRGFNSNFAVGPFIGYQLTNGPKWVFGAGLTLELTR